MLGLLATGAGLAAAELTVGLVEGSASPVVPVGQVFIDLVPKPLKNWAIETFGTNDKAVLVAGALIVVIVIGIAVGVLAMRGARSAAYALTCVIGLLGSFAVLDATRTNLRQAPSDNRRYRSVDRRAVVPGAAPHPCRRPGRP